MNERREWNHVPEDLPLQVNPLWRGKVVWRDVFWWLGHRCLGA